MRKTLSIGILCLTLCFAISCTKTENNPEPTQKVATRKGGNKNRTTTVEQLTTTPLFINLMLQMRSFENRVDAVTANLSKAQLATNAQQLNLLIQAEIQTPSVENKEALVAFIGFSSLSDYELHANNINNASITLRQNYEGFRGLSEQAVTDLINEAIDIATEGEENPQYLQRSKCERMALKRRKRNLAQCIAAYPTKDIECEASAEQQYQIELALC